MKNLAIAALLVLPLATGCVSKSKYNALQSQLDEVTEERDRLSKRLERRKARAERSVKAYVDLWEALSKTPNVMLIIENGRPVIHMRSDILFASGSAELTDEGTRAVTAVARILAKRTEERYQVEGHTDSDPISTEKHPSNWYLGADRSIVVAEAMIKAGMPKKRISASSMADTMPAKDKEASRRIELVIMPDWEDLPGIAQVRKEIKKRVKERIGNKAK